MKGLLKKTIKYGIWSVKVFHSSSNIMFPPDEEELEGPTLTASDVTDVSAEFIADPFITIHNQKYYMFFEVLDKSTRKGVIGLATSEDGYKWEYEKIVLEKSYHLSYPYVFEFNGDYYMIPESCEINKVLLYKSKNFPFEWEVVCELLNEGYYDSSIFHYNNKWWLYTCKSGRLHLFFSNKLEGNWTEHPKSPLITNNYHITRPGGRVVVDNGQIFRYTQDIKPNYGNSVKVFTVKLLTPTDYQEEEVNLILFGSQKESDWRSDGMHNIDQLKIRDNQWLIVVDGHKLKYKSYIRWKIEYSLNKYAGLLTKYGNKTSRKQNT